MAGMSQPGMLCLIKKKDFISSRPQGWRRNQNKLSNVDNEFTVMVNDTAFEGRDSFFEVLDNMFYNKQASNVYMRGLLGMTVCRFSAF